MDGMTLRYITCADTEIAFQYFRIMKFLFNEKAASLSNDAKLLYSILLDRHSLSIANHWHNEDGEVYVICTRAEMEKLLNKTPKTIKKVKEELVSCGLIQIEPTGIGCPDRIYISYNPALTRQSSDLAPIRYTVDDANNSLSYYQLPKSILSIGSLSSDAVLLYALLYDRLKLSIKNGWYEEDGRAFIIFGRDEAAKLLSFGSGKTTRVFLELSQSGLIADKRRGISRKNIIYMAIPDTSACKTDSQGENWRIKGGKLENQGGNFEESREENWRIKGGNTEVQESPEFPTNNNNSIQPDLSLTGPDKTDGVSLVQTNKISWDEIIESIETSTHPVEIKNAALAATTIIKSIVIDCNDVKVGSQLILSEAFIETLSPICVDDIFGITQIFTSSSSQIKNKRAYLASLTYQYMNEKKITARGGTSFKNPLSPAGNFKERDYSEEFLNSFYETLNC